MKTFSCNIFTPFPNHHYAAKKTQDNKKNDRTFLKTTHKFLYKPKSLIFGLSQYLENIFGYPFWMFWKSTVFGLFHQTFARSRKKTDICEFCIDLCIQKPFRR